MRDCTCTCTCIYIYICVYICICMCIYVYIYVYVCVYIYIYNIHTHNVHVIVYRGGKVADDAPVSVSMHSFGGNVVVLALCRDVQLRLWAAEVRI